MTRGRRRPAVWPVAFLALLVGAGPVSARPCWPPPVPGPVADPFREPPCRWCAGNRGIEFRVPSGTVVRAVAAGRVTYAGSVVGVGYVVVRHPDGRRVTYGHLTTRFVGDGDRVVAGERVGIASGRFHFGVRVGNRYVDPAPSLGTLLGRARLVPVDGTPGRPPGPALVRCAGGATRRSSR